MSEAVRELTQIADALELQIPTTQGYLVQNGLDPNFADTLMSHYVEFGRNLRQTIAKLSDTQSATNPLSEFFFDNTGRVGETAWTDLHPAVQGFIVEMFTKTWERDSEGLERPLTQFAAFANLDPAALDQIIDDCKAATPAPDYAWDFEAGRCFWHERQAGKAVGFPPLKAALKGADVIVKQDDFAFDTKGGIKVPLAIYPNYANHPAPTDDIRWCGLHGFMRGYIEESAKEWAHLHPGKTWGSLIRPFAFSDLASETIVQMMKDCTEVLSTGRFAPENVGAGRMFWQYRQRGDMVGYPPVRFDIDDDGKVVIV